MPERPSTEDDAPLVAAARAGDLQAFDGLVERYQRRAVAVAYRLLGNVHDASDVAQDAFVRAFRRLDTLDDERRFGGWLMRIVTNLALNFRRARARRPTVSTDDLVEGHETLRTASGAALDIGPDADASPDARELKQAMEAAIAALPEKQRLCLVLFSIEGMPQKEVAAVLDCTVELVKWNVFQARKALKQALAEYQGE